MDKKNKLYVLTLISFLYTTILYQNCSPTKLTSIISSQPNVKIPSVVRTTVSSGNNCTVGTFTLQNNQSRLFYTAPNTSSPPTCQSQTRTCSNGVTSGLSDFIYESCTAAVVVAGSVSKCSAQPNTKIDNHIFNGDRCLRLTDKSSIGGQSGPVGCANNIEATLSSEMNDFGACVPTNSAVNEKQMCVSTGALDAKLDFNNMTYVIKIQGSKTGVAQAGFIAGDNRNRFYPVFYDFSLSPCQGDFTSAEAFNLGGLGLQFDFISGAKSERLQNGKFILDSRKDWYLNVRLRTNLTAAEQVFVDDLKAEAAAATRYIPTLYWYGVISWK